MARMWKDWLVAIALTATALLGANCGAGGARKAAGAEDGEESGSTGEGMGAESAGGMSVEGILGSIAEHEVERVMQSNEERVLECYSDALDDIDYLEGALEVVVVVDLDGSVYEAFLRNGTLGSFDAESCIINKIRRFRFPKPGGGRAEISHAVSLIPPYDPPPMKDWSGSKADDVANEQEADLKRCLGDRSGVQLTVYVESGGRVVSAGATADSSELYEAATCLARAASGWQFPDPGDNPAKATVSF